MDKIDVVIIGAGFAGASAAWNLVRMGTSSIVILEREELPGMHSSGLNASMIRQFEEDTIYIPMAVEGANFIKRVSALWKCEFNEHGSLILFEKGRMNSIEGALSCGRAHGLDSKIVGRDEAVRRVPVLKGSRFDNALWTESDGVVDISALLWGYLRDAKREGVRLGTKEAVLSIFRVSGGFKIVTEKEELITNCIVNAAGAWAGEIGKMAGAADIRFSPMRRHLYNTAPMAEVDPRWPFVWDIDKQYYFRPESGGLLLGACDEDEVCPGVPSVDHHVKEMLAEKLSRYCPDISGVTIASEWASLRTFAPDRRFVIGEDPKLKGFFWLAGLGGKGVTTSFPVGKLLAEQIVSSRPIPPEFSAERFG